MSSNVFNFPYISILYEYISFLNNYSVFKINISQFLLPCFIWATCETVVIECLEKIIPVEVINFKFVILYFLF
jgi:hypothetical protein